MSKAKMGLIRGIGIGILTGAAVSAATVSMMKSNKRFRKNANKAVQAVTDVIDNVGEIIR
ncbi:hypothetical protein [Caproiciproducens sp. LBM24188]|nr:hypothetical protein [Oscillospiraceae bacterium]HHV32695.1 hypothetical protein [Clostridiales bacterium]